MATPDERSLATIGAIYETALNSRLWSGVLDRLASISGGDGAMMMVNDAVHEELQITVMSTKYPGSNAKEYLTSKITGEELRWLNAVDSLPAKTIVKDIDIWPDKAAYDEMPSVAWLKSRGLYHRCAARLCGHGGWRDILAVIYDLNSEGITRGEEGRLNVLLPHLARAIETQRPLVLLERRYRTVLSVLDRLGIGVMILRSDREVIVSNKEADRILDADDGLRCDASSRLMVADEAGMASLSLTIAAAANAAAMESVSEGGVLSIGRRSQKVAYSVDVIPFREDGVEFSEPFVGVLVFVIDPDHRAMISIRGLACAYDLTEAEIAVCRLVADGLTAHEIADDRDVTLNTVKTQTKSIFCKTHTRNRAELVRRAVSIVPPLLNAAGQREN